MSLATICHFYLKSHCLFLFLKVVKQRIAVQVLVKIKEMGHKALTITNVQDQHCRVKRITLFFFMQVLKLLWHQRKHIQHSLLF